MTIHIEDSDEQRPRNRHGVSDSLDAHVTWIWDWDKVVAAYHRATKRQLEEQTAFRSLDEPRDN